VLKELLAKSLL